MSSSNVHVKPAVQANVVLQSADSSAESIHFCTRSFNRRRSYIQQYKMTMSSLCTH